MNRLLSNIIRVDTKTFVFVAKRSGGCYIGEYSIYTAIKVSRVAYGRGCSCSKYSKVRIKNNGPPNHTCMTMYMYSSYT